MKRMLLLAAGFVASVALIAGCKSLPSIQEQFQTSCSIVNGDLKVIGTSPLLNSSQQALVMNTILPANLAICSAGGSINVTNLKAFHDSLLPAAITIVQGVPALPDQTVILLALSTFGPLVQQLIDQIITAAAPASAPVAASQ